MTWVELQVRVPAEEPPADNLVESPSTLNDAGEPTWETGNLKLYDCRSAWAAKAEGRFVRDLCRWSLWLLLEGHLAGPERASTDLIQCIALCVSAVLLLWPVLS